MRACCLLLACAACYAPDLPDCTVTCSAPDDCADSQVCSGGMCRSPGATCAMDPPPPPTPRVELRVDIDGEGSVDITGVGRCISDHDRKSCMWMIANGVHVDVHAQSATDKELVWTTDNCAGQDDPCSLVVSGATTVGAKFK